jgi:uncharacterized protein
MCAMADAQITVRLQARAHRDELVGMRDGVLVARVSAPPVDGRANRALCRLIARRAGVAPSRVTIVRGERSREKLIGVQGVDAAALIDALAQGDTDRVKRRGRKAASDPGRPSARESPGPRT